MTALRHTATGGTDRWAQPRWSDQYARTHRHGPVLGMDDPFPLSEQRRLARRILRQTVIAVPVLLAGFAVIIGAAVVFAP